MFKNLKMITLICKNLFMCPLYQFISFPVLNDNNIQMNKHYFVSIVCKNKE